MDNKNINLSFPDESISRLQCTLFYEFPYWYITDSDGNNSSTNGTWLLADDYVNIYSGMIFRAGLTSFEAVLE